MTEDVPGWLRLSPETWAFAERVDVSPKIDDAFEGNLHPLPTPSVEYDIGSLLYVDRPPDGTMAAAIDPGEEQPDFQRLLDDFYSRALEVLRGLTSTEEFVFALTCEYDGYLFWPHRAVPGEPWPLRVPGPEAYYSFYAKPDFSWGFFFGWYSADVFGQPLLDAFDRNKPELLSKVIAVDGLELPKAPLTEVEQERLEQQLAEDRVARILFRTELNFAACPEGPWTPELERLHERFERTRERDDLVKLITKIELVLDEQGIEHTPCVQMDDEDEP